MNYQRIYGEFIADRRLKEASLTVYEIHHIEPRCRGGSDFKSNLIRLSYGDHLFAHLLLAKIHGGKCAGAFIWMLSRERYWGRKSRLLYAYLREQKRQLMVGQTIWVGRKHKPETKQKLRGVKTGKPVHTEDGKKKIGSYHIGNKYSVGKKMSPDAKVKQAASLSVSMLGNQNGQGNNPGPEARKKNSESKMGNQYTLGRARPQEEKDRIAASWTPERKEAHRLERTGKKDTPEITKRRKQGWVKRRERAEAAKILQHA